MNARKKAANDYSFVCHFEAILNHSTVKHSTVQLSISQSVMMLHECVHTWQVRQVCLGNSLQQPKPLTGWLVWIDTLDHCLPVCLSNTRMLVWAEQTRRLAVCSVPRMRGLTKSRKSPSTVLMSRLLAQAKLFMRIRWTWSCCCCCHRFRCLYSSFSSSSA